MSTLAERLKSMRAAKEVSQEEVARSLGISRATYANWETSRTAPDPDTLRRLADYFRVSIDSLLGRTPPDNSTKDAANNPLPTWLSNLPPEMQEFVKEESKHGWPYLRLAHGLKMQDLSPAELQAIIETWMDAKRRYEREFGPGTPKR